MKSVLAVMTFSVCICAITQAAEPTRLLRVNDGIMISVDEFARSERSRDIIFAGEYHDNATHHANQIEIAQSLHKANERIALGLEMFKAENQTDLDQWVAGKIPEEAFARIFSRNWNYPWELYRDIFLFCRDHRVPLVALNIDREIARKVSDGGFSSLSADDLKQLPPAVSCAVDQSYMDFIQKIYASHGKTGRSFVNFCEAQMLWDETMAYYLIEYLKKNPSRTVLVLSGSGHAWKKGIPRQLDKAGIDNYVVILPIAKELSGTGKITVEDADYLMFD